MTDRAKGKRPSIRSTSAQVRYPSVYGSAKQADMRNRVEAAVPVLLLLACSCGRPTSTDGPGETPSTRPASSMPTMTRVEDLIAKIDALPAKPKTFELWIPDALTLKRKPVPQDLAIALVVDRLLGKGLFPNGFSQGNGGRTYRYTNTPPSESTP